MANDPLTLHAVILAGGRGTRFWPRSRARTPKQLLNIVGKHTMLEQTVARLRPLIPAERIWTVTNREQASKVREQLPPAARKRVLMEPVGRNTAAAIALAALHVRHAARGDALLAVLPADHYIANPERYRIIVRAALDVARRKGRMVVLGIPPTRPETGFGYIERMGDALDSKGFPVYAVRRFTEKPECFSGARPPFSKISTGICRKPPRLLNRSGKASERVATSENFAPFIPSSKASRWIIRFSSRQPASPARLPSSSFPPKSAGATSAPGPPFMICWPSIPAIISCRVTDTRWTPAAIFAGALRNSWPPSASTILWWSKLPTRC